jgi:hypothetical protein
MRLSLAKAGRRGSAVLVVLILLIVMGALIIANTRVLSHLDRELQQLNREQQRKFKPAPVGAQPSPARPVGSSG